MFKNSLLALLLVFASSSKAQSLKDQYDAKTTKEALEIKNRERREVEAGKTMEAAFIIGCLKNKESKDFEVFVFQKGTVVTKTASLENWEANTQEHLEDRFGIFQKEKMRYSVSNKVIAFKSSESSLAVKGFGIENQYEYHLESQVLYKKMVPLNSFTLLGTGSPPPDSLQCETLKNRRSAL
jgi:hypothetical protein